MLYFIILRRPNSYGQLFRCWKLFSTAIDSWWQMSWKNLNGIFIFTLKVIFVPNFSSLGWFSLSSAVISCHQLSSAVNSCWQLSRKKLKLNFHLQPKGDICAKFQISRLIFIINSCQQLLSVVISCQQLLTVVMKKN